jgi:putative ABC transport system permease protein
MTLRSFVVKNAFRNKRRSILTMISIGFSLLLLTLMMTIWRSFYIDKGSPEAALRLITRHRVSLTFFIPEAYREKIRRVPGVVQVAPMSWFGGKYKDDRPENFFAQFATDPEEIFKVHKDWQVPPDQLMNWQRDRAGAAVEHRLAEKFGWKIGDRVNLMGTIFSVNPELTIRAIFVSPDRWDGMLFHEEYLQQAIPRFKGQVDTFALLADSAESVPQIARAVDEMFHNSPQPTKTETEKAFQLGFIAMLGNVKAFILGICGAVVFAILLVSANTMAMSIRERIREVALLKTLGFNRRTILAFFVSEAVALAVMGGAVGVLAANGLVYMVAHSPQGGMLGGITVTWPTLLVALVVAALVGFVSALLPSYHAANLNISEGLRHVG